MDTKLSILLLFLHYAHRQVKWFWKRSTNPESYILLADDKGYPNCQETVERLRSEFEDGARSFINSTPDGTLWLTHTTHFVSHPYSSQDNPKGRGLFLREMLFGSGDWFTRCGSLFN